jgi:hypothetical protein
MDLYLDVTAEQMAMVLDPALVMQEAGYPPDPWQVQVLRSNSPRLLLICARQLGNSLVTSVRAVHRALFFPGSTILLISRSQDQSDELFYKVMMIYNYLGRPVAARRELASELVLRNSSRIVALPNNPDTIRGYSDVDILIIDEASRVGQATIVAVMPMIMASHGDVIMLSTPAGQGNFFYECWSDPYGDWEKIVVRADDCPRFDKKQLAQLRRDFGPAMAAQEFDCEFLRDGQQVFSKEIIDAIFDTDEEAIRLPGSPGILPGSRW